MSSFLYLASYNEARAKERTATENTDFTSEPEDLGRGKRVRRITRPYSPGTSNHQDSSSCSEDDGVSASHLLENGPAPYLTLLVAQSASRNFIVFDYSTYGITLNWSS